MTVSIILVVAALLVVALLWRAARGQGAPVPTLSDIEGRTLAVDLAAFRNLVDPAEEDYLRAHTDGDEFRRVQRLRLRAALQYVRCAGENAAVLLRLGESLRHHADAEVARAGAELAESAVRLRLYVLSAQAVLRLRLLLPGTQASPRRILAAYGEAADCFGRLCRIQRPVDAGRIRAAI